MRRLASDDLEESEEEVLEMMDEEDEWWHDLQDGKASCDVEPKETSNRKKDLSPLEATEELMNTFRPIRESVQELERLLKARANPNAPVPQDRISPLRHVLSRTSHGIKKDLTSRHECTKSSSQSVSPIIKWYNALGVCPQL